MSVKGKWVRKNIWFTAEFRKLNSYSKTIYLKCIAFCDCNGIVKILDIVEPGNRFIKAIKELVKNEFLEYCSKAETKAKVLRKDELWKYYQFPKDRYGELRKTVYRRDNFTCQYCGSKENLSLDHIIPQSRNGKDEIYNLVTACRSCNSKKGDKTPEEAEMDLINDPRDGDINGKIN